MKSSPLRAPRCCPGNRAARAGCRFAARNRRQGAHTDGADHRNLARLSRNPRPWCAARTGLHRARRRPGSAVAIVNERFAEVFLGGADPVNTQVAVVPPTSHRPPTAVDDGDWRGPDRPSVFRRRESPVVYIPIAASAPATSSLMVRHRVDPEPPQASCERRRRRPIPTSRCTACGHWSEP